MTWVQSARCFSWLLCRAVLVGPGAITVPEPSEIILSCAPVDVESLNSRLERISIDLLAPPRFSMLRRGALVCGLLLWGSSHAAPPSASGAGNSRNPQSSDDSKPIAQGRRLTGKFLHITGKLGTYQISAHLELTSIVQTFTPTHSTRRTPAPQQKQHAIVSTDLPVYTAQRRQAAIRPIRSSTRPFNGSTTTSRTTSTL
jgi:hypothetical protein